jgi:hypothetical protein
VGRGCKGNPSAPFPTDDTPPAKRSKMRSDLYQPGVVDAKVRFWRGAVLF